MHNTAEMFQRLTSFIDRQQSTSAGPISITFNHNFRDCQSNVTSTVLIFLVFPVETKEIIGQHRHRCKLASAVTHVIWHCTLKSCNKVPIPSVWRAVVTPYSFTLTHPSSLDTFTLFSLLKRRRRRRSERHCRTSPLVLTMRVNDVLSDRIFSCTHTKTNIRICNKQFREGNWE